MAADRPFSDTTPEVAARQRRLLRSSSVAERAQMIEELCEITTVLALAGIDRQYPGASASERARLLAARRHGRALAEEALGPLPAP